MVKSSGEAKSIFDFESIPAFLKSHYDFKKEKNTGWSYQAWVNKLGIKSNASLIKVIKQERFIGSAMRLKLENYFEFQDHERNYFRMLNVISRAEVDPVLRKHLCHFLRPYFSKV